MNQLMRWFVALLGLLFVSSASAATDIAGVITEAGTLKDAALVVAIAILLWVVGRRVLRRFV